MKTLATKPPAVLLVLCAFALTFLVGPSSAQAGWIDHSDELPGTDFPTGLVVAAGVATAALITILLVKKHHDDRAEDPQTGDAPTHGPSPKSDSTSSHRGKTESRSRAAILTPQTIKPELGIYCGLGRDSRANEQDKRVLSLSDLKLKAGVSISF